MSCVCVCVFEFLYIICTAYFCFVFCCLFLCNSVGIGRSSLRVGQRRPNVNRHGSTHSLPVWSKNPRAEQVISEGPIGIRHGVSRKEKNRRGNQLNCPKIFLYIFVSLHAEKIFINRGEGGDSGWYRDHADQHWSCISQYHENLHLQASPEL